MGKHFFGAFKIRDHAADQRCADNDIAAFAAGHICGLLPERDDLFGQFVDRHKRRLIEHDTAILDRDDRAGGSEVDRHRIGHELFKRRDLEHI
jgi:hypothetical protein